jgi:putative transposase
MKRQQAFKFELHALSGVQWRKLSRFGGSCRFVYNEALKLQHARHEAGEKKLG